MGIETKPILTKSHYLNIQDVIQKIYDDFCWIHTSASSFSLWFWITDCWPLHHTVNADHTDVLNSAILVRKTR